MYIRVGILLLALSIFFTGCQNNNTENSLPSEQTNERYLGVENSSPETNDNLSNEQIANHLANIAAKVPNVKNATAIVAGPYAVVGIDVDRNLDRSRVGTIKYSVSEALRMDPYGKTAVVVADGDITQRIRNMSDKINQGYPVQGIVDELAAIVGRYMPDFPTPQDQPEEPDQNKEVIPEDQEKDLDDIQNDQSNDQKHQKQQ